MFTVALKFAVIRFWLDYLLTLGEVLDYYGYDITVSDRENFYRHFC